MDWVWFLIGVLATYRFAHAFSLETGPGAIFNKSREWVIGRYGYTSWQAEFTMCPLCQSFWLSGLFTVAIYAGMASFGHVLLLWWGMAGSVAVLHLVLYKGN